MRILICGASGFIGRALAARLEREGHSVLRGVRRPRGANDLAIDYAAGVDAAALAQSLAGVDAAVNAAGILVESGRQRFEDVHARGPMALFEACRRAGVRRVLQISALGADRGDTGYFRSKRAADEFLQSLPLEWQILRPSVVYGTDGAAARSFRMLASLPAVALPAGGHQRMQPVHIDDLAEAALRLLDPRTPPRQCIELAGPRVLEYRQMLRTYGAAMGFAPPLEIPVPAPVIGAAAALLGLVPGAILTRETWKMLQEGSCTDPQATRALLGRPARDPDDFIPPEQREALRAQALAAWRRPLLLGAAGAVAALVLLRLAGCWP